MAEYRNAGYFWLGLFIFLAGGAILEHFEVELNSTTSALIGICFICYIIANIISWLASD